MWAVAGCLWSLPDAAAGGGEVFGEGGLPSWGTSAAGALHLEGEAAQRQAGGDEGRGAGAGPREESPTNNLLGAGGTRP